MSGLAKDLRFGWTLIVKHPGFTATAVLSLALGIGACVVAYSYLNQFIYRPLPAREPNRLVAVLTRFENTDRNNHSSYLDYRDLRDRTGAFDGVLAHFFFPVGVKTGDRPQVVLGQFVTASYFTVVGVAPAMGRAFRPEEDGGSESSSVVVISHRFWTRAFNANPSIVGTTVLVNSRPYTIVGVAPEGFTGLNSAFKPDVWLPLAGAPGMLPIPVSLESREQLWLGIVGRLKPGVSLAQARSAADALATTLAREFPASNRLKRFRLVEADRLRVGLRDPVDDVRRLSLLLLALVALVLLIACLNVASLHLARALAREREIAMRLSLGASHWRVFRQLSVESLLLAALAGGAGLIVAVWAVDVLGALQPAILEYPVDLTVTFDWRVLVFAVLAAAAAAAVFGIAPAAWLMRRGRPLTVRDSAAPASARGVARVQSVLVAGQVGLSVVLLVGAGLTARSLGNAKAVDPGFEVERGLLLPIDIGFARSDQEQGRRFFRDLRQEVNALPGVRASALAVDMPLGQYHIRSDATLQGYQPAPDEPMVFRVNIVSAGYFEAIGTPIVAGRAIDERDGPDALPAAVINETMARRYFPGVDPLGRTLRTGGREHSIVGIMRDGKYDRLDEAPQPYFCLALDQQDFTRRVTLVVGTAGDPSTLRAQVTRVIRTLEPNLPLSTTLTMREFLANAVGEVGGPAYWLAAVGLQALLLAMVGVYGLTSYTVGRRRAEFGVRLALGARPDAIVRLVLRQGLSWTLTGVALGLLVAFAATPLLARALFQVGPRDPLVFAVVPLVLGVTAIAACYLPARSAARVDPALTLRSD